MDSFESLLHISSQIRISKMQSSAMLQFHIGKSTKI